MKKSRLNEHSRNKGRMAVYAMAGVYLLFMAYSMFQNLSASTGGEKVLVIIFMIFFALFGAFMVIRGLWAGYQLSKPPVRKDKKVEIPDSQQTTDADSDTDADADV